MAAGNTPAGQKRRQGMKVLGFAADRADRLAVANYYAYRYNGFDMKFHAHPNAEIMYNDGGACEIFWKENGNNKKLALKKGQFAVLPSQTQHMLYVPQGGRCDILNLELTLSAENGLPCAELEGAGLEFLGGGVRFAVDTANVGATIKKLHEELGSAQFNAGSGLQIAALLAQAISRRAHALHRLGQTCPVIMMVDGRTQPPPIVTPGTPGHRKSPLRSCEDIMQGANPITVICTQAPRA